MPYELVIHPRTICKLAYLSKHALTTPHHMGRSPMLCESLLPDNVRSVFPTVPPTSASGHQCSPPALTAHKGAVAYALGNTAVRCLLRSSESIGSYSFTAYTLFL